MTPSQVLDMPARLFWLMLGNIGRVRTWDQLALVEAYTAAKSEKPEEAIDRLTLRLQAPGSVDPMEAELDRDGLAMLKRL